MNKLFFIISLLTLHLFASTICSGQTPKSKFSTDSSKTISKTSFDKLVDNSLKLIQTKELSKITDKEHIDLIMCLNTIFVLKLSGGQYQTLETVAKEKEYSKNLTKIYPEWTPNKGMGLYIKKLKIELYGTPRPNSYYKVTK
jgi:hypothetical protein